MAEQDFINAGFTVVGTENNENKLLSFLKENYPNVIRDTEINLEELNNYYFTKKVFKSIQSFADKLNLSPKVLMNNKIWEEFYK